MRLQDKIALVTGASRGIGRAIALGLAGEGAHLGLNYHQSEEAASGLKAQIQGMGRKACLCKADVSQKKDVTEMVNAVLESFGRIDILVNAAGIYPRSLVADTPEEMWDTTMAINLKGVFLCCQAVLPTMMEKKEGKIVSITSGRGTAGAAKGAHYAASKAGIIAFTKSLAMEVAPYHINVNAIATGTMFTDMLRAGKNEQEIALIEERTKDPYQLNAIGKPEDVVGTVTYLVTDACAFTTGQVIFMRSPHWP